MELREWLAIAMFASFIVLIFTGFPVAWVLGGLAVLFTALAIIADTVSSLSRFLSPISVSLARVKKIPAVPVQPATTSRHANESALMATGRGKATTLEVIHGGRRDIQEVAEHLLFCGNRLR